MADFLRFHLAGLAPALYAIIILLPFLDPVSAGAADGQTVLGVLGGVVLVAQPVGYAIHQFAVSHYRGPSKMRPAHHILATWLDEADPDALPKDPTARGTVLDSLLEYLMAPTGDEPTGASKLVNGRWNHVYARTSLGFRGALLAAIFAAGIMTLVWAQGRFDCGAVAAWLAIWFTWNLHGVFWSALALGAILAFGWTMNRYLAKLIAEIHQIEQIFFQENKDALKIRLELIDLHEITSRPTVA